MPAIEDLHPGNIPLTNISIRYSNPEYIGEMLFPTVVVQKESDRYYTYGKDNFRVEETVKGDRSEANKVDYTLSTGNYNIVVHALEGLVTPRSIANADTPLSPFQDMTEHVTDLLKIRLEVDIATNTMSSSTYNTGLKTTTGLPAWNNSSGDVMAHIISGKTQIAKKIGRHGNTVAMDELTFNGLKNNTTILDRIKYTSAESISRELLARLFEVDQVLVGKAIQNNVTEGRTDSLTDIWSEGCAILYVERNPGLRKPTFGYMFRKAGSRVVETRNADNIENGARWVRVIDGYDDKVVDANAGYLLQETIQ